MIKKLLPYKDQDTQLEGYLSYNETRTGKRPTVVICHAWSGRDQFVNEKADEMASKGYVGFALDVYGKGILGSSKAECASLMDPFILNRQFLQKRLQAGIEAIRTIPVVDHSKIAVMGFCFGGLCALDIARSGTDIKGAISVHGLLNAPDKSFKSPIKSKILALHGHEDPLVPPQQVMDFEKEMTLCKADWQINIFGNTMHAFTNPIANDPSFGTVYNPLSAQRAWNSIYSFLDEIFT